MILKDKQVLITGASGGLGRAVAEAFLEQGARVIAVSRSVKPGDLAHANLRAHAADLAAMDSVQQVFASAGRVDAVIHTVGGFAYGKRIEECTDQDVDSMWEINFGAAWNVFRAAIPAMRASGGGSLAAIGSRSAVEPGALTGPYNIAKAALVSLVRTIAVENREAGITANIVLPGTMDTPANRAAMPEADPRRWVRPEQVAQLLVYLASDGARQVTGTVIPITGGE